MVANDDQDNSNLEDDTFLNETRKKVQPLSFPDSEPGLSETLLPRDEALQKNIFARSRKTKALALLTLIAVPVVALFTYLLFTNQTSQVELPLNNRETIDQAVKDDYITPINNNSTFYEIDDTQDLKVKDTKELFVKFGSKKSIYPPLYLERDIDDKAYNQPNDKSLQSFEFYKVGEVFESAESGNKIGDLILVEFKPDWPCKGFNCQDKFYLRYIKSKDEVTFLPKISSDHSDFEDYFSRINPFKTKGLKLNVDSFSTITVLEYHRKIMVGSDSRILNFNKEHEGLLDKSKLVRVFNHPVFGDVYMTKPGLGLSAGFIYDEENGQNYLRFTGCKGPECFLKNYFFIFRPDGTFLTFVYRPDFSVEDIVWNDNSRVEFDYYSFTAYGCGHLALNDINNVVLSSLVDEKDLIEIGRIPGKDYLI